MPHFERLLTDVGPADPPARAARRALKVRLRAVAYYVKRGTAKGQAEEVHQLRVWTRRTTAALRLFEPLLAPGKARRLRKRLRQLRKTAGAARDLDVLQAQLGDELDGPLAERLRRQRAAAQRELARLLRRRKPRGWKRRTKSLLRGIGRRASHEQNGAAFAPWCRGQLAPLVNRFSRCAAGGPRQSDASLHQWRLAAKRLKYALELAVVAVPPRTWTPLYALLAELQDRLGRVCDALVEQQRLHQWLLEAGDDNQRQALARLTADCRRRLAAGKQELARWWTASRGRSAAALCRRVVAAKSAGPSLP